MSVKKPVYVVDIEGNVSYTPMGSKIRCITEKTISGVYIIKCASNGKVYVGASGDILRRLSLHRRRLRAGIHVSKELQKDFNKFGEGAFYFATLDLTENLTEREQYYCDKLQANKKEFGYNKRAKVDSNKGNKVVISPATRAKLSLANKGKTPKNLEEIRKLILTRVALYEDGRFVKEFSSQREAARETGIDYRRINNNLRRGLNIVSHPNFSFKYV